MENKQKDDFKLQISTLKEIVESPKITKELKEFLNSIKKQDLDSKVPITIELSNLSEENIKALEEKGFNKRTIIEKLNLVAGEIILLSLKDILKFDFVTIVDYDMPVKAMEEK
ncbi:MAG: hypothetical protein ABGF52_11950 [Candidatus Asgardarchaeum sp.]